MRRLAHKIHVTVLFVLFLFAVLAGVAWHAVGPEDEARLFVGTLSLAADTLPAADAPPDSLQQQLRELSLRLKASFGVWSADGQLVARTDPDLEIMPTAFTSDHVGEPGFAKVRVHGRHFLIAKQLRDGRFLVMQQKDRRRALAQLLGFLVILAAAIGLGALPLTRRLTRRLERLRGAVEELGAGDLAARVPVQGRDEVAALARSFNAAAARIEHLVEAQRTTLAGASHELRSPLARLRVALELLAEGGEGPDAERDALRRRVEDDIAELDALIDEILLATRLESLSELEARDDDVDLLALAAEEGARVDAEVSGQAAVLRGNERLLRRLVRNLVDNAARHGDAGSVRVTVTAAGPSVRIEVCDDGPGVPEAETDRIFEPFYRPAGAAESGRGYGLGLALVRRIAHLHGGTASCIAGAAGGTCFRVDLPA